MRSEFLAIIFLAMLFTACEEHDVSYQLNKDVINTTSKDLAYVVKTNIESRSATIGDHDSSGVSFIQYGKEKSGLFGCCYPIVEVYIDSTESIYNLSDTTSYIFNARKVKWDSNDSIYMNQLKIIEHSGKAYVRTEKLIFTECLYSIMQKDYSLLDKFRDYYSMSK